MLLVKYIYFRVLEEKYKHNQPWTAHYKLNSFQTVLVSEEWKVTMASIGFSCVSLLLLSLISICLFHLTCSCSVLFHNVSSKPNLLYKEVLKYKINDCCFVWSDSVTTVTIYMNVCYKETTACMFFCMNYILAEKCTFWFMDMSNTVFLCLIIHVLWCEMQKIIESSKLYWFK